MRKAILALAAVIAFSGAANAGSADTHKQAPAVKCTAATGTRLDCASTGSVEKMRPFVDENPANTRKRPRLGIDVNPWITPNTF